MWKETTVHARNRRIFEEELDPFLPRAILDFHAHVFPLGAVPEGETFSSGGHPIASYNLAELSADLEDAYPGRSTSAVCFGLPFPRYDRRRTDAYLARECDRERFFPLRLLDPGEDTAATLERDLTEGCFFGVKPYPDYVRKPDVSAVEIPEMLPPWAMEVVNDLGLIVLLHIPRPGRLADPLNRRHIAELCRAYPRASIVLAHIGRSYFTKSIAGHIEELADLPNLYFDLAMVGSPQVLEYAFARVEGSKLLYGTDIPIALAPGKSVEINDQYTYVTPVPWEFSISDDHGKLIFTSFLYEGLRAVKVAAERLELSRSWVEGLFHGNGMRLLQRAMRRSHPQVAGTEGEE